MFGILLALAILSGILLICSVVLLMALIATDSETGPGCISIFVAMLCLVVFVLAVVAATNS